MTSPEALANSPKTFPERNNWMQTVLASDLPHAAKVVALAMAFELRINTGRCDPSFAMLETASHVPERSIYRLVDLLEHQGWISVTRITGTRNNYTLLTPDTVTPVTTSPVTMSPDPCHHVRGTLDTMSGDHCQQGGSANKSEEGRKIRGGKSVSRASRVDTDPPPEDSVSEKKKTGSNSRARKTSGTPGTAQASADAKASADDFAAFWAAYPLHKAKADAERAFAKAVKDGTSVETLIEGAKRYAKERAGQDPKYTKHPATWLNKHCWEDEPPRAGAPTIDHATGQEVPAAPARSKSHMEEMRELGQKVARRWIAQQQALEERDRAWEQQLAEAARHGQ